MYKDFQTIHKVEIRVFWRQQKGLFICFVLRILYVCIKTSNTYIMILGVSEWLGKKLDMKTEHVRIGFLLALILAGSGVLLYLIFFVIKSIKNE